MHVLNFGHPLSQDVLTQLGELQVESGFDPEHVVNVKVQVDQDGSFAEQAATLVDAVGWSPADWQVRQFAVVLPGLAPIAAAILAEIHGRSGYFATVVRLKPVPGVTPPRFAFAELLDLSGVRETARTKR